MARGPGWSAPVVLAALFLAAPSVAHATDPLQVASMRGAGPCVALTFDDGPHPQLTPKLLSILKSKGATATFFIVGSRAAEWPDLVIREAQEGFEIGNHSWDHPFLSKLSVQAAANEIGRTDEVLLKLTGKVPTLVRAPYGSLNAADAAITPRPFVAWSVDSLDWHGASVAQITNNAVSKVGNGGIILMHDIHARTIEAVPAIIDGLRARGFQLVTVSDLLSGHCGGTAIAYSLPSRSAPPKAPSTPLVSSLPPPLTANPAPGVPPVEPASNRRYKIHDDEE